jgi:hypothetical protein
VVTTDYGQPFHKSGANVGAYFSTPGLVRSSLAVPSSGMNVFLASAKQVGMEFLGSSQFPQEMQGRVILGGFYANRLEQHELHLKDGVYSSTQLPNIIETKNNVFRPVEVRCGPDGALYVADWYNPIIGHYQASFRHPNRDAKRGRIWRVTDKSRQFDERGGRWEAYQQHRQKGLTGPTRPPSLTEIEKATQDASPLVRLEAVVAAAKIPSPEAIKVALKVLDKPMDSFIERALWLAVHATVPQWKKQPFEILNSLPPKHLAFLVEKEGSAELLGVVRTMLAQKGESMPPETRRGLLAALVRKGEPGDMLMALKLGVKDQAVLEDLSRLLCPLVSIQVSL